MQITHKNWKATGRQYDVNIVEGGVNSQFIVLESFYGLIAYGTETYFEPLRKWYIDIYYGRSNAKGTQLESILEQRLKRWVKETFVSYEVNFFFDNDIDNKLIRQFEVF